MWVIFLEVLSPQGGRLVCHSVSEVATSAPEPVLVSAGSERALLLLKELFSVRPPVMVELSRGLRSACIVRGCELSLLAELTPKPRGPVFHICLLLLSHADESTVRSASEPLRARPFVKSRDRV